MNFPLIGITTRCAPALNSPLPSVMVQKSYVDAVINAGGLPVLIPSDTNQVGWSELVLRLDGILFTGGGDIAIEYFGGEAHPAVYGIDEPRDAIELSMARTAVEMKKPFLGICRGLQVVNVAMGGTLFTHIPDQLPSEIIHDFPGPDSIQARTTLLHLVSIDEKSELCKLLAQSSIYVNSLHHQGIKELANGLHAVGHAPDGLIEAVEVPDHPFGIGVQWHPEWMTDQAPIQKLFKAFVDAAKRSRTDDCQQ